MGASAHGSGRRASKTASQQRSSVVEGGQVQMRDVHVAQAVEASTDMALSSAAAVGSERAAARQRHKTEGDAEKKVNTTKERESERTRQSWTEAKDGGKKNKEKSKKKENTAYPMLRAAPSSGRG